MSRPLTALDSLVLTVFGVVFLLPLQCAYACSCAMPPGSQDALADSDAVFSGEVVAVEQGTACGYHFEEGREYLVYAYTGKQGLEVDSCGATKPLSEADANLAALGDGERPTGGEVLSDTSGGFSVPAMVGVAGLVMAASLLVVARLVRTGQTRRR